VIEVHKTTCGLCGPTRTVSLATDCQLFAGINWDRLFIYYYYRIITGSRTGPEYTDAVSPSPSWGGSVRVGDCPEGFMSGRWNALGVWSPDTCPSSMYSADRISSVPPHRQCQSQWRIQGVRHLPANPFVRAVNCVIWTLLKIVFF